MRQTAENDRRDVQLFNMRSDTRQQAGQRRTQQRNVQGRTQQRSAQGRVQQGRAQQRSAQGRVQQRGTQKSIQQWNIQRSVQRRAQQRGGQSRVRQFGDVELWDLDAEERRSGRQRSRGNPRPVQSIKRRKAKRRRAYFGRALALVSIAACLALVYLITSEIYQLYHGTPRVDREAKEAVSGIQQTEQIEPPPIVQDFIEVNDYSRPGTKLESVKSIFVHYTANPKTSAMQNRSYFANLAQTHERSASAHLIIGYEGEIVQCIPLDEQAYGVKTRNGDSISVECCYLAEDGSFTQETYDTLIHTLAWLLEKYDLSTEDILRHYDCGGKLCPKYYVEHEDAWETLLMDVEQYIEQEAPLTVSR